MLPKKMDLNLIKSRGSIGTEKPDTIDMILKRAGFEKHILKKPYTCKSDLTMNIQDDAFPYSKQIRFIRFNGILFERSKS